ncbi:MAG: 3-dehydroquinate synthase [Chloroflexi bacterium]|nr:3-dehydroquinate synthase [Chloroflexota bacterium]
MKQNIFITGFSGTGKTTVSREVARRMGWRFVDVDDEIVAHAGKPIEAIFDEHGEEHFRRLEGERLGTIAEGRRQVVSTGGGIIMDDRNRQVMTGNGIVVCLEARPETILDRLSEQQSKDGGVVRPMLSAKDPLARIISLKAERQFNYTLSDWTVHTDGLNPAQVADEVLRAWSMLGDTKTQAESEYDSELAATVRSASGDYPIWVGWGNLDELGERVQRRLSPPVAYIITDEGVYRPARRAQLSMEAVGIPTHMFLMPPGEQHKTLETTQLVFRWLAERKAERGHLIIAVGGGVVGDLAGFVAATYLRGMPFVQVPTSLLAMMDSSIGGKTAVDLPQGKNLVGAFYQPKFVLSDVSTLRTLPARELTSGWAEAIKHGLILDDELLASFESRPEAIKSLERDVATDVIRRSVAVKANIVSQDERETLGIRILLNYGHTIGHAIEASTGYGTFLHGEAVSIGMMGAGLISNRLGLMSTEELDRQRSALEAYGLPLSAGELDLDAVRNAMLSDKKTSGKTIRWVLLDGIGGAVTRNDVPPDLVQEALESLSG